MPQREDILLSELMYQALMSIGEGGSSRREDEEPPEPPANPPVITSGNAFDRAEGVFGTVFTVTATGGDGPLVYSLIGTDSAFFDMDTEDGHVETLGALDFENPQDANTDNVYELTVGVSDGVNPVVTQNVTVTVTDVAESDTWNPADKSAAVTLSNGNLTATMPNDATRTGVRSVLSHNSGLRYFEIVATAVSDPGDWVAGLFTATANLSGDFNFAGKWVARGNGTVFDEGAGSASLPEAIATGEVLMVAVNFTAGRIWFGVDGVWAASGDPATNTIPSATFTAGTTLFIGANSDNTAGAPAYTMRTLVASFTHAVPSGFSSWSGG